MTWLLTWLTVADDVQDILHGEEVEPWEALPPALQVLEQGAAADLQVVVHLLQEWQDPWRQEMLNEYIS